MNTVVAVVTILGAVTVASYFMRKSERRKVELIFAGREPLSSDDYFVRYFSGTGIPVDVAVGVREVLEEQLGTDLSRLSAEDDFSSSLKEFFAQDSLVDVEIVYALEERFGIKITNEEAASMHSIRDIVATVHRKALRA